MKCQNFLRNILWREERLELKSEQGRDKERGGDSCANTDKVLDKAKG